MKRLTQESRNSDHQRESQEESSQRAGRSAPGRTSEDVSGPSGVRRSSKQLRAAREGPQSTTVRHDCEASQQETSAEVCGDTVKHRPDTSPERDMRASSQWCEGQARQPFTYSPGGCLSTLSWLSWCRCEVPGASDGIADRHGWIRAQSRLHRA